MNKTAGIVIGLVLVGAAGVAWALLKPREPGAADQMAKAVVEHTAAGQAVSKAVALAEQEREEYVRAGKVEIKELKIDPDTKPGLDGGVEFVPGLLRVSGQVVNNGDKTVGSARLTVTTYDDANKVLGVYVEDVIKQAPGVLGPGESRPFKWQIPDKKGFSGKFDQKLQ
jgi:hypothetical protein